MTREIESIALRVQYQDLGGKEPEAVETDQINGKICHLLLVFVMYVCGARVGKRSIAARIPPTVRLHLCS